MFQKLNEELKQSQELFFKERAEKLAALRDCQSKQNELEQANNDLLLLQEIKKIELKNLAKENDELRVEIVRLVTAHEHSLVKAHSEKQAALKRVQDDLTTKANAESGKIQIELEKMAKLKEKELEIAACEKEAIKQELERQVTKAKETSSRLSVELQKAHEKLETAIADTVNLHNEVLAKTVQVKQYNKQTESFKAKVEEANTKLDQAQQNVQQYKVVCMTTFLY